MPAFIVQSDRYNLDDPTVTCLITTAAVGEKEYRVELSPNKENGLKRTSNLIPDKIIAIPRVRMHKCIGVLEEPLLVEVHAQLMDFLSE
jgi:mRNA-degrading endonuclease toxin of MazEF toxin-antitoxin module